MDFLYNFFQTCDRSKYFKGIFVIDRLILCTISREPAIDRSKCSKKLDDRSKLKAITVGKVAINRSKFSKE
jgi:hypothetical protein